MIQGLVNKKILHRLRSNNLLTGGQRRFHHPECSPSTHPGTRTSCERVELDFTKASDQLVLDLLPNKFYEAGISISLLSGRYALLQEGPKSVSSVIFSEVSQGRVLGPTVFLVYIKDVTHNLNLTSDMRTDDFYRLKQLHSYYSYQGLRIGL